MASFREQLETLKAQTAQPGGTASRAVVPNVDTGVGEIQRDTATLTPLPEPDNTDFEASIAKMNAEFQERQAQSYKDFQNRMAEIQSRYNVTDAATQLTPAATTQSASAPQPNPADQIVSNQRYGAVNTGGGTGYFYGTPNQIQSLISATGVQGFGGNAQAPAPARAPNPSVPLTESQTNFVNSQINNNAGFDVNAYRAKKDRVFY